MNNPSSLVD